MADVDLSPLIAQARAERKWLHCTYQDLWFSPDELEAANREGRFRWGPINWTLRDPQEHLNDLIVQSKSLQSAVNQFQARMARE